MFWNNKKVEFEGLPVVLSRRTAWSRFFNTETARQFLAYKVGEEWSGLVGYEQFREELDVVNRKLNLILDHLNLQYIPETEKKEPAKFVKRARSVDEIFNEFVLPHVAYELEKKSLGEKPKRKYTKRKKSKK